MNEEREMKNSINKFELEGNVGNIRDIYTNKNGKSSLRFDLGQNNNGNTQFVPIVIKGALVDTYGKEIEKGNWISVKGRISAFSKDVEKDGKTFKEKSVEILGFEITDRTNNKIYTSDGQIQDISNSKDEMER
ncbi:MAG: single-stranded DNA-binding protein [Bacilli bacterium]|nr:single-stranded DNA-binding protein [Bacilli bacterium]